MTRGVDVAALATAVVARLREDPTLDVFDGEPTARQDSDGRAHPYAAVYSTPGAQRGLALCSTSTEMTWSVQVTAAGGDRPRCRRAVARVRGLLLDWAPVIPGAEVGPLRELDDYAPSEHVDAEVAPSRTYVPLIFVTDVSAGHA